MGGWAKAGWVLFVLILPIIGILIYLIARGGKMAEHRAQDAAEADKQFKAYVKQTTGGASAADEVSKLADLHAKGVITDAEFEAQKAKILS